MITFLLIQYYKIVNIIVYGLEPHTYTNMNHFFCPDICT